jgi:hypothetical protein
LAGSGSPRAALAAALAVAGPLFRVESTVPGADSAPVRAIPAIEAERRAAAPAATRTDTGALTPEMLAAAQPVDVVARETVERAGTSDLVLSDVFLMNVTEAPGVKAPTTIDARPLG